MTLFVQANAIAATATPVLQSVYKVALHSVGDDKTSYNGNQLARVICVTAPQIKVAG